MRTLLVTKVVSKLLLTWEPACFLFPSYVQALERHVWLNSTVVRLVLVIQRTQDQFSPIVLSRMATDKPLICARFSYKATQFRIDQMTVIFCSLESNHS